MIYLSGLISSSIALGMGNQFQLDEGGDVDAFLLNEEHAS